jgi:hypothetical protein
MSPFERPPQAPAAPEQFNKADVDRFRSRVKVIGDETMIFGVTVREARLIQEYALREKGLALGMVNLSPHEMRRHKVTDETRKFGVELGGRVDSHLRLFDE